ncbi:MAG: hypothetical protein AAGL29_11185 [Bacteroidota bacterium]
MNIPSKTLSLFVDFPNDSGPIYKETFGGGIIAEPFNTFSNLVFVAILMYWGQKVYKNTKQHLFLAWVLPIIGLSFIGGTIYHGTRSHEFWLLLDWVPIMLLCAAAVIYFIFKIVEPTWQRMLIILVVLGVSFLVRALPVPPQFKISLGYIITALTVLAPILVYQFKTRFRFFPYLILAFGIFGLAVFFRTIDLTQTFLSIGTHWLWHFFGGVAVHCLIAYIFKDNLLPLTANKTVEND